MRKIAFFSSLIIIFTIPWEDAFTIGSFGTITRIFGLFTMILWACSLLVSKRIRKPNWFHLVIFLFIIWNIASLIWSVDIEESQEQVITYIQLGLLVYILWDLYTSKNELIAGMQAYILGSYVTIISTVINYVQGQQIYLYSGGRYAGAGLNAVDLALTLSLGLPIAWFLAISMERKGKKRVLIALNYIFIPAALFAIILSGSRTALFAAIPALVYILATFNRFRPFNRLVIFIVLVGSMLILQLYIPRSVLERFTTTANSIITGDLGGRVSIWQASISIFQENPILGIGSGALNSTLELGTVAHNTYLSVLTELGLIGFFIYVLLLAIILTMIVRQSRLYSQLWLAVFMVWMIGVLSLTWEYRKTTWLLLGLIVISASINSLRVEEAAMADSQINSAPFPTFRQNVRIEFLRYKK
jgi:O-antigen ligase